MKQQTKVLELIAMMFFVVASLLFFITMDIYFNP